MPRWGYQNCPWRVEDLFGVSQPGKKTKLFSLLEKLSIGSKDNRDVADDHSNKPAIKTGAAVVGLMDGTETLARGVLSGVTGVFVQPVKGAMKSGTKGFVKGFGKGLVGAVAQPVSGAVGMMGHMAAGASGGVRRRKNSLVYPTALNLRKESDWRELHRLMEYYGHLVKNC